jgi:molybdopterin molybdotransferase
MKYIKKSVARQSKVELCLSVDFPCVSGYIEMKRGKRIMLSFEQALASILREINPADIELCELGSSGRRILARDVRADTDIPPFDNSSMDGYAVHAEETQNASVDRPVEFVVSGEVGAGDVPSGVLTHGAAARIFTGGPLPPGATAVIEQELVDRIEGKIRIKGPVSKGRNIRSRGEDIAKGSTALQKGLTITAARQGILASLGVAQVQVYRIPQIAVLTTGNELVDVQDPLAPGKIRDSNSFTLSSLIRDVGGTPLLVGRAGDSVADLREKIRKGLSSDVLITSGGASVGDRDLVLGVLKELGVDIKFWKVNIKPGMPIAFGVYSDGVGGSGVPVFVLPGNPVSTMVTFLELVRPAISKMRGLTEEYRYTLRARLEHEYEKQDGKRHFARGILRNKTGDLLVRTTGSQSSGVLTSLSLANCLITIPEDVKFLAAGSIVEVEPLY